MQTDPSVLVTGTIAIKRSPPAGVHYPARIMVPAAQRLALTRRRLAPGGATGRRDGRELGAIFVGGAIGTMLRAEVAVALPTARGQWPWATFVVNIAGAFLLGYVTTRLQERLPLSAYRRPLLGTGLCGGLTTFSTMQLELLKLLDGGQIGLAVAYALVSAIAGFGAVALATNLVRRTRATG
jgi:CrcB protein